MECSVDRWTNVPRLELERFVGAVVAANVHGPALCTRVEVGAEHLGPEASVRSSAELVGAATEVLEQHVLRREVLRPVAGLRERVAV